MSVTAVIGTQWGDEGKGKITDYLAERAEVIVRYQGGSNAGHTISVGDQVFKLKLIPSGVLYPGKDCVLGNGMVIDPAGLLEEMAELHSRGVAVGNLFISDRAQVIMPYHRRLDALAEESLGKNQIGTTRRGIGPAYMDKFSRFGVRVKDLLDRDALAARLQMILPQKNALLEKVYGEQGYKLEELLSEYLGYAEKLAPCVRDVSLFLHEAWETDRKILLEGAQGTMLDIDHGTYPFVTSSNPTAGGACSGSGLPPTSISSVAGVVKAYTTRVGEGPFPTELDDETGELIRRQGMEFGTVTGRPRRVGWLDGAILRYARRLNGISKLIVTKLDVLSGLEKVAVSTGYRLREQTLEVPPASLEALAECRPHYQWFPGWEEDISQCKSYQDLPVHAREYLGYIAQFSGAEVAVISVGPRRDQTIVRKNIF